jgi:hypothetical protein
MPLINLQTNLKSLKYGHDRQGGGDSGLPYITKNINTANLGLKFDDGLVRGGVVNAAIAGAVDTARIFKFLKDPPKGPLFLVKQIGLQLSNPRLEIPKNPANIASGLPDNVLAVGTNGLLQPTRIYNLGINTLAQIPVNAFGIHFNRHGLLPIQSKASKYEAIVTANNDLGGSSRLNRLVGLTTKFRLGDRTPNLTINNRVAGTINTITQALNLLTGTSIRPINVNPQDLIIDDYAAGPNSVYGIGRTTINRYSNTEDSFRINSSLGFSSQFAGNTRNSNGAPQAVNLAQDKGTGTKSISTYPGIASFNNNEVNTALNLDAFRFNPSLKTYAALQPQIKTTLTQEIPDTGDYSATPYKNKNTITTQNPQVNRDAADYRYYGKKRVSDDGSISTYNNTEVFNRNDASIFTVIFRAINPFGLATIDRSTGLPGNEERWAFNGYLNGYKDGFNATWNDINYVGRAESFYVYNKFKRSVSFGLQVPCFNKRQLFEKHRALGQLASTTAGSYNNKLLGGVLLKVNVGNYLVGEYATLDSIDYSIPSEASWDIADDALLSMYLDVSFNLTIIHKELPQYQQTGATRGFFGHLPDPQQSPSRQGGFITPIEVVKKFTRDEPPPPPLPRTEVRDTQRTTPTLPPSVPTSPIIPTRR